MEPVARMKKTKHATFANPAFFLQAIFGMAALMMIFVTYDFISLPSGDNNDHYSAQMSELRAMIARQDEQMSTLHEDIVRVIQEEHIVAEQVSQLARKQESANFDSQSASLAKEETFRAKPHMTAGEKALPFPKPFQAGDDLRLFPNGGFSREASLSPNPPARPLRVPVKGEGSTSYTQPAQRGRKGPGVDVDMKGLPKGNLAEIESERRPDMTPYVKKLSMFDDKGCSSGQKWDAAKQECHFMPQLDKRPTISPKEFMEYFKVGRALILTNFTDHWKAFQNWEPQKLKAKYGQNTVNVQKGRDRRKDFETAQHLLRRDVNFGEFIDNVMSHDGSNDIYLTANNNLLHKPEMRDMLKDMDPFYPGFLSVDPTQTHFWFGPGGTKTPLHYDPISLFHTHVKGRKLWRLWPPEMGPYLYHKEKVYSEVDFYEPDHKKFPLYKYAHVIEVVIEPGETLFIPTGWWHTVDALDTPTISLSATSWLGQFGQYEMQLRRKWPMKVPKPPGAPPAHTGPATPGEKTPRDFDLHFWSQGIAKKHAGQPNLPAMSMNWDKALSAEDMEAFRRALGDYHAEKNDLRIEAIMYMLLNPTCSQMSFDWQAWMVENVGLKNPLPGIVSVLASDGDKQCMHQLQASLKRCLARGSSLWDDDAVSAARPQQNTIMQRIRDNVKGVQIKQGYNNLLKIDWESIRHVGGWKPPSEFQIQNALNYPGAELLSDKPRSVVVRGFLTEEECDSLIHQAQPNLVRSAVIGAESDAGRVSNDRTSMGSWLLNNKGAVAALEQRTAKLTGLDESHQEGVHVLRYLEGENYNRHLDACDTGAPDKSITPECERFLRKAGDRVASLVVMLQKPEAGGATAFPRVKQKADGSVEFNMHYAGDCKDPSTLQTTLNKGDAVLFWSYYPSEMNPDGQIDWSAEHTGCKVEHGVKWIATIWSRGSKWRQMPKYSESFV